MWLDIPYNSLDFSLLTPQMNRTAGFTFASKQSDTPSRNAIPGPGYYDPQQSFNETGTRFGREPRLTIVKPTQERLGLSNLDLEAATTPHKAKQGFSFGMATRDLVRTREARNPGPGHYELNYNAVIPKTASFALSLISQKGKNHNLEGCSLFSPKDPLKTLNNFQRFSALPRRLGSDHTGQLEYHRIVFATPPAAHKAQTQVMSRERSRKLQLSCLDKNEKDEIAKVQAKLSLEYRIAAAQLAKECIGIA